MAETKQAKLEERISAFERELSEARSVISKLSKQLRETTTVVGVLNRDVADLKSALKATQDWAKGLGKEVASAGISRYE